LKVTRTISGLDLIVCLEYSPTGRCFAIGLLFGSIMVVDSATHTVLHTLDVSVSDCAFSPDGTLLAVAFASTFGLWDVATGSELRSISTHHHEANVILFTPDGKHIISASRDKTARVWDVASCTPVHTLSLPGKGISVALSASGTLLAVGCMEGMVALFDVAKGYTPLPTFKAHDISWPAWFRLCFSPVAESAILLTCSRNENKAKVWDLSDPLTATAAPKPVGVLSGHTDCILDVRFSGDGALIATASQDKTVKVWDALTGRELRTLTGHTEAVVSVAFHPTDDDVLVSCGDDGKTIIWTA